MATQVSIRDYLKRQGVNNVGWDNQNKQATVGGKSLNVNTNVQGGRSFADRDELTSAISRFRQNQQSTPATATTPTQQPNNYQSNVADIISSLQQRANQQPEPFQYNQYQDPNYQNAMQMARRNAQQGSNMNMAEMNRRGILNSTITSDRGERIQQQELGRVTSEVLPQLIDQAYQRYMNDQAMQQQQFQNLAGLADQMQGYDQQAWQNRFNYGQAIGQFNNGQQTVQGQQLDLARQGQQFDQKMATDQSQFQREQFEYQQARDGIADERYKQEFDEDVRRFGLNFAMDKAMRQGQLAISQQNANTSAGQLALSQQRMEQDQGQRQIDNLYRQWETTGVAPEGIPGVAAGSQLPTGDTQEPLNPSAYQTNPEYGQDVQYILTNPEQAGELLRANAAEFIQMYGTRGYQELLSYLPDEDNLSPYERDLYENYPEMRR